MHDSGADDHCVLHMHHGKSLDACILLLHCVYGAQGGVNGPTQLRSTTRPPVLTAWITPLDETKVHDSGADGHCVLHMHHVKSLDACILLLNYALLNIALGCSFLHGCGVPGQHGGSM